MTAIAVVLERGANPCRDFDGVCQATSLASTRTVTEVTCQGYCPGIEAIRILHSALRLTNHITVLYRLILRGFRVNLTIHPSILKLCGLADRSENYRTGKQHRNCSVEEVGTEMARYPSPGSDTCNLRAYQICECIIPQEKITRARVIPDLAVYRLGEY
jgi:hypothetical protein